jgi:PAS domain S-box-containing protein
MPRSPVPRSANAGSQETSCQLSTELDTKTSRLLQAAALESEQRYKRLLASVTDYVYSVTVERGQAVSTEHGPGCEAVTGYSSEEFEADQALWYEMIFEADRAVVLAQADQILRGETPPPLEHRITHKDGSLRWIRNTQVPRKNEQGKLVGYDGLVYDITERKRAEQQLTRANEELAANEEVLKRTLEELRAANLELRQTQMQLIQAAKLESVGAVAAGVAHEVKNPLQTLLMGLDYLVPRLAAGNENMAMVLTDMRDAVNRANGVVSGLLQLSADTVFELRPEDLNTVVKGSLRLVNTQAIAAKIKVVRKLESPLPRVRIDRIKIEQVFINLFLNALQAMSAGGVLSVSTRLARFGEDSTLRAPAVHGFQGGERLVIAEVKDQGSGIKEANLPKIFDPFFTTKATVGGTGLGLSVVKKIVDLHGGVIGIHNAPEGGVVATLILKAERE